MLVAMEGTVWMMDWMNDALLKLAEKASHFALVGLKPLERRCRPPFSNIMGDISQRGE
jgi:hypothetical protein